MDAVCLLALYIIMNGLGGIEGIIRADSEGCVRFVTSLLKERNGLLDARWTGKVTPMVRHLQLPDSKVANEQVERVRAVGTSLQRNSARVSCA